MSNRVKNLVAALMAAIVSITVSASALAQPVPDAPVKSVVPPVSALSAPQGICAQADPCDKSKDKADKKSVVELKMVCGPGTTGDIVLIDGWRKICRAKDPVRYVVVRTPHDGAANEAHYQGVLRATFADEMNVALGAIDTRLAKLEKDGEQNAADIAKLKHDRDQLMADRDQLAKNQAIFEGALAETKKDLEDVKDRLDKVEHKVAKMPEGGVGALLGFVGGPDGFNPTLQLNILGYYPLPADFGVMAELAGGILHRTATSTAIGHVTLAAGFTYRVKPTVTIMVGGDVRQDIDGPGQRVDLDGPGPSKDSDVEHFVGRGIGGRGAVYATLTDHLLFQLNAGVGACEVMGPEGVIKSGVCGHAAAGFNWGSW